MKTRWTVWTVMLMTLGASAWAQESRPAGEAARAGMSAGKLAEAMAVVDEAIESDAVRGAVVLVARRGVTVVHEARGWRDLEAGLAMEKDSLFRMASNTKPVVAAAVMTLVETGKLDLDAPVSATLPAFGEGGSAGITIRHLLSHTSGLRVGPIFYRPLIGKSAEHPDAPNLRLEVARFGETGPEVTPGTSYSYSNAGFNTLGALIEAGSGVGLAEYLKAAIYDPLGMKDSLNHESRADHARMSKVYRRQRGGQGEEPGWTTSWKPGDEPDYPFVRASGGMISTAADYLIFCRMFLNGGEFDGRRILRADTIAEMTRPQTRTLYSNEELESQRSFYGLGWTVSPDGVYNHGGSDGTYAWVDPERELIGLVFTQTPGPGANAMRSRFRALVEAACIE